MNRTIKTFLGLIGVVCFVTFGAAADCRIGTFNFEIGAQTRDPAGQRIWCNENGRWQTQPLWNTDRIKSQAKVPAYDVYGRKVPPPRFVPIPRPDRVVVHPNVTYFQRDWRFVPVERLNITRRYN